ncbi:Phospholipase D1 [Trichinella nelsoni]|uniref:Phospholipase n=1 Tax=Trichinella nelsoni TaxID=6336 RepID=A0A0V0RLE3_9BILA|nr:Phospholipase D1 [Trichinella nelsoni]
MSELDCSSSSSSTSTSDDEKCDCSILEESSSPSEDGKLMFSSLYDKQTSQDCYLANTPITAEITEVAEDGGSGIFNAFHSRLQNRTAAWQIPVDNFPPIQGLFLFAQSHLALPRQEVVDSNNSTTHRLFHFGHRLFSRQLQLSLEYDSRGGGEGGNTEVATPSAQPGDASRDRKIIKIKQLSPVLLKYGYENRSQIAAVDQPTGDNGTAVMHTASLRYNKSDGTVEKSLKRKKKHCRLPSFPIWPLHNRADNRKERLEKYLSAVLHVPAYRNLQETREFIEVSRFSFVSGLGGKNKEGYLKKRPGGRLTYGGVVRCCAELMASWQYRWVFLKDSYLAYVKPEGEDLRAVMLLDPGFHFKLEMHQKPRLIIENLNRTLVLKSKTKENAIEWKDALENAIEVSGKQWLQNHDFGSSFPKRRNVYGRWYCFFSFPSFVCLYDSIFFILYFFVSIYPLGRFVDGKSYMENLANMLELAKEQIFITGWWLSPEIYLKRPAAAGRRWRLDEILKRKAEEGIRVYVLLYKEVELALGINSAYSKRILQQLHANIKVALAVVMRHPDHLPGSGVFLWAHHEKLVIIDQNIAFVGGIDLCYGRWDDPKHRLTDFGSVSFGSARHASLTEEKSLMSAMRSMSKMLPVVQMCNAGLVSQPIAENPPEQSSAVVVKHCAELEIEPEVVAGEERERRIVRFLRSSSRFGLPNFANMLMKHKSRMQRNNAADCKQRGSQVLSADDGETVDDAAKRRKSLFARIAPWMKLRRAVEEGDLKCENVDDAAMCYEEKLTCLQMEDDTDPGLYGCGKLWIGKDYANFIYKDFTEINLPYNDFIDRRQTPRMPWHDIAAVVYCSVARDLARHFIERWNACKTEKAKHNQRIPYLIPKSYEKVEMPHIFHKIAYKCHIQVAVSLTVIRSCSQWSFGSNMVEDSIHRAYVHLIKNAKHYIYIENQFFVSLLNSNDVHNSIAKALYDRILQAYNDKETFRVYVMMPLLPGFEGQLGTTGGSALQAVLHWTYCSLCKGPNSLLFNLAQHIEDPSEYIVFCSLRTHATLMEKLVSEIIYIHSKLMIVDDLFTIIGSANINDRSMLGKRDSEVAIYVEDCEFSRSSMNGQLYQAGRFAFSLRTDLFAEHLGLSDTSAKRKSQLDIRDPVSTEFFTTWKQIAARNADIFEKVFGCIPSNSVKNFVELKQYKKRLCLGEFDLLRARTLLEQLNGNLVLFPMKFLCQSDLSPSPITKEGLAPSSLFT